MLIQRFEIENYRSLKSVDVSCDDLASSDGRALLAILGRNGGGKSSILYALEAFYDVSARITKDDCYARDPANEIMVRVTYGKLRPQERKEFQSYVTNDQLIVTKRFSIGAGSCIQKYYAAARQIPDFAELRGLGKRDRITGFKALVASQKFQGLGGAVKNADQVDAIMSTYEAEHPELLKTVEREEQFFGPKEVGGGKLDKFTKFVLVPAVRNASTEVQKKGVIYDLIDMIVLRRVNARSDVRALRAEMKTKIEKIFCQENLNELTDLGASISKLLEQYAPGSSLRLTWGDPVTPTIPLPSALADLVEDDFPCPITHAGHGLQRALILTLLQHLALTERPASDAADDEESAAPTEGAAPPDSEAEILSPDLILAIEEPELYLHPSRARYLSELLMKLAKAPEEIADASNQVIYATHSPYFVDLHRFDQVRVARKPRVGGQPAPCCTISQYSLEAAAKELARVADGKAQNFNRDSFRARSLPVMTTAINEGFFATTVVVVEGLSDVGVLWRLQEILKQNWSALGIAVVPAIGKENIDRPVVVFRGLKIPTYFIFDADKRHAGTGSGVATAARNRRYQRMAGVVPVDFPETQVNQAWAVLDDDIEATLRVAVGSDFEAIAKGVADELRYDNAKSLMKNTEGAARLVEVIYSSGHRVPILEEIVKKITALHHLAARTTRSSGPEVDGVEVASYATTQNTNTSTRV